MENKKYYLGLDLGTNSCGWCVTDENYKVIKSHKTIKWKDENEKEFTKKQGCLLWGSRLFEEAHTAKDRRMARTARRRLVRRRQRILMLREIFECEINKIDPYFYTRLDQSFFWNEDKNKEIQQEYGQLFNDQFLTDQQYHKDYPTIYHLRKKLLETDERIDIRLIYLALAHMIKYRGNFLREGDMIELNGKGCDETYLKELFDNLNEQLNKYYSSRVEDYDGSYPVFVCSDYTNLLQIFKNESRISDLKDEEKKVFNEEIDKKIKDISFNPLVLMELINGAARKIDAIFPANNDEENDELLDKKIDFSSENFETDISVLKDSELDLILACKDIYNLRVLVNLLGDSKSISYSMVERYEEHERQLDALKRLYKWYAPDKKKTVFNDAKDKKGNIIKYSLYGQYINWRKKDKENTIDTLKNAIIVDLPIETFNKYKSGEIADFEFKYEGAKDDLDLISNALAKAKENTNALLPRQNSSENGVFPYQLNESEMRVIIEKQGKYYPFLKKMALSYPNFDGEDYKLISILKFKIPYYVGPIGNRNEEENKKRNNHWAVKTENDEKIYPWNFNKVVDLEKTATRFIENLTNSCTYIFGEPVLSKYSLTFQMYKALNDLNNLLINNKEISKEDKDYLIENVYLRNNKIKSKLLYDALGRKYKSLNPSMEISIKTKGNKEEIKDNEEKHNFESLSSYIDMINVFGSDFYKDESLYQKAEEIIKIITTIEDKNLLKKELKKEKYNLTEEQINKLSKLRYKGWSPLSRKLIDEITSPDEVNGENINKTILDVMRDHPYNFMEIYESNDSPYSFKQIVGKLNENSDKSDVIEASYLAPSMKRSVRQAFHAINELKHHLHIEYFDKIFLESTRKAGEKGKMTNSREKQIKEYLNAAKKAIDERDEIKYLEGKLEEKKDQLKSKKLFLYFLQLGRSVYTGEKIDLDRLDSDYDIDHIIPQAKIKDDSLNNIVLVEKAVNNRKQDRYPIPPEILKPKGKDWIYKLNKCSNTMMPKEKMNKLYRVSEFTDDEEAGFINRQLTMTNQTVKAVADILRLTEVKMKADGSKTTEIVFSKASLVSDFRNFFSGSNVEGGSPSYIKLRDVNDYHHAQDAYLNIVVGNVYYEKFNKGRNLMAIVKSKKEKRETLNLSVDKVFTRNQYDSNNKLIWKANYNPIEKLVGNKTITYYSKKKEFSDEQMTIDVVTRFMDMDNAWMLPLVTQMMYEQKGSQGFFNKISFKNNNEIKDKGFFPLKYKEPYREMNKYGGYSDLTAPYFTLVKSKDKKGKKNIYSLENVPSIYLKNFKGADVYKEKEEYFEKELGLIEPKIVADELLIRTQLSVPYYTYHKKDMSIDLKYGFPKSERDALVISKIRMGISAKSADKIICINMSEIKISTSWMRYYKWISKILGTTNPNDKKIKFEDLVDKYYNKQKQDPYDVLIDGIIEINRMKNHDFYFYLTNDIFERPEYKGLHTIGPHLIKIKNKVNEFDNLTTLEQINTIYLMIQLLSCKSINVKFNETIDSSTIAYIGPNKKLEPGTSVSVLSDAGLTEKIIFTVPND